MFLKFSIPVSFLGTISFSFPTFFFVLFFCFSSAKSTNLANFLDSKTNNQIWYQDSESSPDLVFSLCLHSIPQSGLEASAPLLGRGKQATLVHVPLHLRTQHPPAQHTSYSDQLSTKHPHACVPQCVPCGFIMFTPRFPNGYLLGPHHVVPKYHYHTLSHILLQKICSCHLYRQPKGKHYDIPISRISKV